MINDGIGGIAKSYNVVFKKEFDHQGVRKARWVQIGKAWPAKSGKGFNLTLEALPVGGTLGELQLHMFPDTGRPGQRNNLPPAPEPEVSGPPGEEPPPPTDDTSIQPAPADDCPF